MKGACRENACLMQEGQLFLSYLNIVKLKLQRMATVNVRSVVYLEKNGTRVICRTE